MELNERRRHIRVYFDSTEELVCECCAATDGVMALKASVLDLSLGGLHLAFADDPRVGVGDQVTLLGLLHHTGVVCEGPILAEVRWIFSREDFSRHYLGCQFLTLDEDYRSSIANLVSVKLLESGSRHRQSSRQRA